MSSSTARAIIGAATENTATDNHQETTMKLKLTVSHISTDHFARAFGVLCADTSLPVKERYAIGRTMQDIRQHMELYESERMKLVKELGMSREEYLRLIEQRMVGADEPRKAALAARARGALDFIVDDEDPEKFRQFSEKIQELKGFEFDVFLDHKVRLTDAVRLSAADIAALDGLVEVE